MNPHPTRPALVATSHGTSSPAASAPGCVAAPTLGPDDRLVGALVRRLLEAGTQDADVVVMASAGSSDPVAQACFEQVARDLSVAIGQVVPLGYVGGTGRPLDDVVADVRAQNADRRVVVSSLLMAPGFFHDRVARCDVDVVSRPLLDAPRSPPGSSTSWSTATPPRRRLRER